MLVRLFDPVVQFQNKGGALNTAGRLEVYLEGTDDLAQVYVDEEGLVPLQQPVILDNNGRSQGLYVESGVKYRLDVHTNHGDLLFTVRNMVPSQDVGGYGTVTPEQFGAKGDGVTDDSEAIQKAIDYLEARRGGIISFGAKNYVVRNTLYINNNADNKALQFIGRGKQQVGGGMPSTGSFIVSYCVDTIKIKSGTNNIFFDGLNFIGMVSRSEGTKLFSVYGTTGYVARVSFRNMFIRSFDYAFDLRGGSNDGYVDGSVFFNIQFSTINKCIRAKHLEVCQIELCNSEPFLHYFLWATQSNTLEIKNCIIRSLGNSSRTIPITPIGIILDGVANYGKHINIHDCIFENSDVAVLSNNKKISVSDIQYINDCQPFASSFIFGKWGGGSAEEIELKNITTTYEDGTSHYDVEVIKTSTTLNLFPYIDAGGNTQYEMTFTISALRCDGIRIVGWEASNNIFGAVSGVERFFVMLAKNFIQWINRNKIHFTEADENSPTDPQGNAWSYGDIICGNPKGAINNWIGKVYTQRFGFVPFGQPIISATRNQVNVYTSDQGGVCIFQRQDRLPLWSDGSKWVAYDGCVWNVPRSGDTASRPTSASYYIKNGFVYLDETLMKPIWYLNGNWYDATGTQV